MFLQYVQRIAIFIYPNVCSVFFVSLLLVRVLVLVAGHVAGVVDKVLPSSDALSLSVLVESFLMTSGERGGVRQPVYSARLHRFLYVISAISKRLLRIYTNNKYK